MNPYLFLDVPRDAGDAAIRRAYLDAIKEATPETDPLRFKALTVAYDRIKDPIHRHRLELFGGETAGDSPLDAVARHFRLGAPAGRLAFEILQTHLRACSKT
jgi:curved DNA-binding protein CbpA